MASAVETFKVTDSLTIDPETVSAGDEVTLKPRDFLPDTTLMTVDLGGEMTLACCGDDDPVQPDGSDYVFDMPGGFSGALRITVTYSDDASATSTITVDPSNLELSKAEVAPNETIIISGSGFSEGKTINVNDIKLDGKSMVVDDAGTQACGEDLCVKTTSSGEFTATVSVWARAKTTRRWTTTSTPSRLPTRGFRGQGQDNHPGAHGVGDAGDGESAGLHHHQRRELAHQHG